MSLDTYYQTFENAVEFYTSGLDADAEYSESIDFGKRNWVPKYFSLQVKRTTGSTNTVSVKLQGKGHGQDWGDIVEATTSDGVIYVNTSATPITEVRFLVTTVGSGNTLWACGCCAK